VEVIRKENTGGIAGAVLGSDQALNVVDDLIQSGKELVGTGMILQMLPKAFNEIEFGRVRR
jgi:hypothetical protein